MMASVHIGACQKFFKGSKEVDALKALSRVGNEEGILSSLTD